MSSVSIESMAIVVPVRTIGFSVVDWPHHSRLAVNPSWSRPEYSANIADSSNRPCRYSWCNTGLLVSPGCKWNCCRVEDDIGWVLDIGAWFIGVNSCPESVLVCYVFHNTSPTVLNCKGVGADNSSRSVSTLLPGAGTVFTLSDVVECVRRVAVGLRFSWCGVDWSTLLGSRLVRLLQRREYTFRYRLELK